MNKDCIFCKIVRKELASTILYEDEKIIVINDINPVAKTHVLFIPKEHVEDFMSLQDDSVLSSMRTAVQQKVEEQKLMGRGYKIVVNGGGAQIIDHLHFHLIGPVGLNAKL